MITAQDKQTFADISVIIKMMPEEMRGKISKEFIKFLEQNKDTEYTSYIDSTKPIKQQKLHKDTQTMLALIYRDYLCDKEERAELVKKEKQELEKIQKENSAKYEIKFKEQEAKQVEEIITALAKYEKENIFTKFWNKIKKIFKIW